MKQNCSQLASQLNKLYLWIIHNKLFWQLLSTFLTKWSGSSIFYSTAKLNIKQSKRNNFIFISFKKGKVFLKGSVIAPKAPPQLLLCNFWQRKDLIKKTFCKHRSYWVEICLHYSMYIYVLDFSTNKFNIFHIYNLESKRQN